MSRFWLRRASISIARTPPLQPLIIESPIRIEFRVEKKPLAPPNTANIRVFNLSDTTRKQLQAFGADVVLSAGYVGDLPSLPVIFRGQARTIDSVRHRSEWVTHIQCGDGEIPMRYSMVNESFGPGTSMSQIAKSIAKQLGAGGVNVSDFLTKLAGGQIPFSKESVIGGYVASGNAFSELEKLGVLDGYSTSIQDGILKFVPLNGFNVQRAILISPETGMTDSPDHGTPDHTGLPSILKVHSFLIGKIQPFDPFVLKSESVSGNYRAEKVIHRGDTHHGDWKTEVDGRPIGAGRTEIFGLPLNP